MKTIEQIIEQEPVFLNDWSSEFDVFTAFMKGDDGYGLYISQDEYFAASCPHKNVAYWEENKALVAKELKDYDGINVLFASYGYENYNGSAFVIYAKDGKLYEVNGGHCSCYGLEGQWEDGDEVVLKELSHRLTKGTLGEDDYSGNAFNKELKEFIGIE